MKPGPNDTSGVVRALGVFFVSSFHRFYVAVNEKKKKENIYMSQENKELGPGLDLA